MSPGTQSETYKKKTFSKHTLEDRNADYLQLIFVLANGQQIIKLGFQYNSMHCTVTEIYSKRHIVIKKKAKNYARYSVLRG